METLNTAIKSDLPPIRCKNNYITLEEIKETINKKTVLKTDCSLFSISSDGKDKFEDVIRGQISKFQNRLWYPINGKHLCGFKTILADNNGKLPVADLIRGTIEAMEDMVYEEGPTGKALQELEKKLTTYQQTADGKLDRRKKRMRLATEYLTKHIVDLERMLETFAAKIENKECVDRAVLKLLKIRGIIEDICLLCQRVGSAQKEDSLSSDIKLLVQSLDKFIGSSGSLPMGGPLSREAVNESFIVPKVCSKDAKESPVAFGHPIVIKPLDDHFGMANEIHQLAPMSNSNHSMKSIAVESEIVPMEARKDKSGLSDLLDFKFESLNGILNGLSMLQSADKPRSDNIEPIGVFDNMEFMQRPRSKQEYATQRFITPKLDKKLQPTPSRIITTRRPFQTHLIPPSKPFQERSPSFLRLKKQGRICDQVRSNDTTWKQNGAWSLLLKIIFDLFNREMDNISGKVKYLVYIVISLVFLWWFVFGKSCQNLPWFIPATDYLELRHYGAPPM